MGVPLLEGSFAIYRCRVCRTGAVNTSTMLLVYSLLSASAVEE